MKSHNSLKFRLDGLDYTLTSDKPVEQMETIVKAVEEKILEIRAQAPYYSQTKTTMLAALQISEELFDLKQEYQAIGREIGLPEDTLF